METLDYNLPQNAYASFDARSLRDFIIETLNNDSSIDFTDQNFQGSNLNAIINIVAYSYHTLLFYLNQTSSEAMFTETQLYENINRIVKLIDYKPLGKQTSIVPIQIKGTGDVSIGYYTIPRYSFITGNKTYSFNKDITIRKITTADTVLTQIEDALVYEGRFKEYPNVNALGENFEVVKLLPGSSINVDYFNIHVYVKEQNTNKWYEYNRVPSLYLASNNERCFEVRINHNKNYEIKFGNDINGRKLRENELISIYYLETSGKEGSITKGAFSDTSLNIFNTTKFDTIFTDIKDDTLNFITIDESVNFNCTNTEASTEYSDEESVESIKQNAPKFFSSDYKLLTINDFETFIRSNFGNMLNDFTIFNNEIFVKKYLAYLQDALDITDIEDDSNALYNQYNFADNFNINNLYVCAVPKFVKSNTIVTRGNYLSSSLKQSIKGSVSKYKVYNAEIVFIDPMYMSIDFYIKEPTEQLYLSHSDNTRLYIKKSLNTYVNNDTIISKVYNILKNYFSNYKLGVGIDIKNLNLMINSIDGVDSFYTGRVDKSIRNNGLSMMIFNPIHKGKDIQIFDTNKPLEIFQTVYISDLNNFRSKIVVI
jgi:hypothetical protein